MNELNERMNELNDSFNRNPEIKVRLKEGGVAKLAELLENEWFFSSSTPKLITVDEGVMISFMANIGTQSAEPFPVDILIPLPRKEPHV